MILHVKRDRYMRESKHKIMLHIGKPKKVTAELSLSKNSTIRFRNLLLLVVLFTENTHGFLCQYPQAADVHWINSNQNGA
ncbi:hypothetical protein ACJX0J_039359, partial [Zea mays]